MSEYATRSQYRTHRYCVQIPAVRSTRTKLCLDRIVTALFNEFPHEVSIIKAEHLKQFFNPGLFKNPFTKSMGF